MSDLKIGPMKQATITDMGTGRKKSDLQFGEIIKGAIDQVNHLEKNANQSVVDLLQGKTVIHETMIALQKVDISTRLFLSIRNKVIDAYREIMQMHF
jgi:flagellar hook-basal body complex protein FliE